MIKPYNFCSNQGHVKPNLTEHASVSRLGFLIFVIINNYGLMIPQSLHTKLWWHVSRLPTKRDGRLRRLRRTDNLTRPASDWSQEKKKLLIQRWLVSSAKPMWPCKVIEMTRSMTCISLPSCQVWSLPIIYLKRSRMVSARLCLLLHIVYTSTVLVLC